MTGSLENYLKKGIDFCLLALAVATPFIFTTQTTELFEVPKMFFVYLVSTLLFFLLVSKSLIERKITFPIGPATIAFGIFLLTQIASTITSQDKYLSIFGYPTRLNGGLLSLISYFVIFIAAITQLDKIRANRILLALVISATAVSLWGIPAHFGFDPSCYVLTGNLNSGCWTADFNPMLRIFSTLGQPNWLASYLVLALPISLTHFLLFKSSKAKLFFGAAAALIFMALVLTTSRAGILGAVISIAIFAAFLGGKLLKENLKIVAGILAVFVVIWLAFGTALTSRIAEALTANKSKISSPLANTLTKPSQSALTTGGTESSQIRFIVWQGALKVFQRWPILGSGPETFVNSYYLFRPATHNQTTEGKFFYNKAHNEFLNYLATTGVVGLLGYLGLLLAIFWQLAKKAAGEKSTLAALAGYQVTIFFGFSTVATQTVFFLAAASALAATGVEKTKTQSLKLEKIPLYTAVSLTAVFSLYLLTFILRLALADTIQKRAESYQETAPSRALIIFDNAQTASPADNPYLSSAFAYALAAYATDVKDENSAQKLVNRADALARATQKIAPNNFLTTLDIAKTYLLLSQKNEKFQGQAEHFAQKLPQMAPTYPVSYLQLAKTQIALDKKADAQKSLQTALELRPDYAEAKELLDQLNSHQQPETSNQK